MGDPGLRSKFIEMQQEAAFAPREYPNPENDYRRGLRMDRERVLQSLARATIPNHVAILRRSLSDVEKRIKHL